MFIDKNSLIVDGVNLSDYIVEIEYGYNKGWANDSGRNLKFEMTGSLLGIFVKLKITFRKLSQEELELLAPVFDSALQNVTYYDPVLKRLNTMETYTGDWSTLNRNTFLNVARANESFTISFIARKRRPER